jgi:pimeloyl-ACP methyl ester carboxylesterase
MALLTLEPLQSGSSPYSLVFFPGGPGLSWHYFKSLMDFLPFDQTMFGLNYASVIPNESTYFEELKFELILLLQRIPNPILVTHAFSSMLALSMERIASLNGLILISPAINNTYATTLPERLKAYTDFDGTPAAANFWMNPTDENYAKYLMEFLPFYFRPEKINKGHSALKECTFAYMPYLAFVHHFLPNFTNSYIPSIPTLVVSGDDDYICPPNLFKDSFMTLSNNISVKIIKGGGHFPWIDTPIQTLLALKEWYETFNRSPAVPL